VCLSACPVVRRITFVQVKGRVALLGDAAHLGTPVLGQVGGGEIVRQVGQSQIPSEEQSSSALAACNCLSTSCTSAVAVVVLQSMMEWLCVDHDTVMLAPGNGAFACRAPT
jgi:hypothetical protein